ncbi:uncharacterized protein V1516DRAFT_662379 [Lipomyces oligophaga]|uniref:uncharacterized protein n=1 Tax=Lipomyces oligophaga TaxID=45792 RepID=UPI0034CDFE7A
MKRNLRKAKICGRGLMLLILAGTFALPVVFAEQVVLQKSKVEISTTELRETASATDFAAFNIESSLASSVVAAVPTAIPDQDGEPEPNADTIAEDQLMFEKAFQMLRSMPRARRSSDDAANVGEGDEVEDEQGRLRWLFRRFLDALSSISYEEATDYQAGPAVNPLQASTADHGYDDEPPPRVIQHGISEEDNLKSAGILRESVVLLTEAAAKNNSDALYLLGEMSLYGNYSYPTNYTESMKYYQKLSDMTGNSTAQNILGFMYATGLFGQFPRDQAKALMYHTFAAYGGNTRSEMTLAYRYHMGIGTPRNCEKALFFYKRVAEKAMAYWRSGPPGGRRLDKHTWKLADDFGGVFGEGASESSSGMNSRKRHPKLPDSASIDDVMEYLEYMSEKSDIAAQFALAKLLYYGTRTLNRNYKEALLWFHRVAEQAWDENGNVKQEDVPTFVAKSAGYLGRMYLRGEGTPTDYDKAFMWYERGQKAGDLYSINGYGYMRLKGLGPIEQDVKEAARWFERAAIHDVGQAQVNIGKLNLEQGQIALATNWFEKAIRHGHIEAFYYLAELHNQVLNEPSCGMSALYYKIVAEKAEELHSPLEWAHRRYDYGETEQSLLGFLIAAEHGYESAQANVAYLLDRHRSVLDISELAAKFMMKYDLFDEETKREYEEKERFGRYGDELALIYWTRASRQSNIDAMVRVGDYYFKGIGGERDPEKAAACYQAAAEYQQSAMALWNLGWMHENGLGVEQDFHLAKRFYDLSLTTNTEAYVPVTLALLRLRLRSFWNSLTGGSVNGIGLDVDVEKEEGEEEQKEDTVGTMTARKAEAEAQDLGDDEGGNEAEADSAGSRVDQGEKSEQAATEEEETRVNFRHPDRATEEAVGREQAETAAEPQGQTTTQTEVKQDDKEQGQDPGQTQDKEEGLGMMKKLWNKLNLEAEDERHEDEVDDEDVAEDDGILDFYVIIPDAAREEQRLDDGNFQV